MSGASATKGPGVGGDAVAFVGGSLFAIGLMVAGVTKPDVVQGFLNVTGPWNPTLLLVMAGAVGVHFTVYRLIPRLRSPLFDDVFHIPTRRDIDRPLVVGAALFGVGWGMAGFCPGPGLLATAGGLSGTAVFVAAMTCGIFLQHITRR